MDPIPNMGLTMMVNHDRLTPRSSVFVSCTIAVIPSSNMRKNMSEFILRLDSCSVDSSQQYLLTIGSRPNYVRTAWAAILLLHFFCKQAVHPMNMISATSGRNYKTIKVVKMPWSNTGTVAI